MRQVQVIVAPQDEIRSTYLYIYIHTNMISSVCAIVSNRKGKYVYTLNIHYIIIMWYNQSMPAHQGGTHMNSCVHVQSSSYYRSELDLPRIWKENVSGLKVQCLPGDQMMYSMWILYIYIYIIYISNNYMQNGTAWTQMALDFWMACFEG